MSGARQTDQAENERKAKKLGRRQVEFAPGPLQDKYSTDDGHPDHEGRVARPKRSLGASWGHDLTPSSIRELESQLGEECRPSLDRLKRRVGLLPLRKRPKTFLTWMIDSSSSSEEEEGGSGGKGKGASAKKRAAAAGTAAAAATAGAKAKQPRKRKQPPQRAAEAELGPATCTGAEGVTGEEKQGEDFLAAAVASVMGGEAGPAEAPTGSPPSLAAAAAAAGAAAAAAAGAQPALGGRKTRQKAAEAAAGLVRRLVPPNRLRPGLSWLTGKEQTPIPPLPKGAVPGLGAPLAEPLPAVTHTFGRRGGGQAASKASHSQGQVAPATAAAAAASTAAAAAAPAAAVAALDSEAAPPSSPGSQSLTLPSGAAGSTGAEPKPKRSRRLGSLADPHSKSMAGLLSHGTVAAAPAEAAATAPAEAAAGAVPVGGAPAAAGDTSGTKASGACSGSGSQPLPLPSAAAGNTGAEPKPKRSRRLGSLADPHSRGMAGLLCRGL